MPEVLLALPAALLGILVGALINALADDLPHYVSPRLPHYPNGAARPPIAWIALLAFLTGRREGPSIQRTAEEEKHLSLEEIANLAYDTRLPWRHVIVEGAMAGLYAFLVFHAPNLERGLIWGLFLAILMLITVIDLEHRLILFAVVIPSLLLVLLVNLAFPAERLYTEDSQSIGDYLLGALLGGGTFFIIYLGGFLYTWAVARMRGIHIDEIAFGFGDVMLATLSGLMLGWAAMILAMFIAVFAGAAGALLYLLWRAIGGRRFGIYAALPYGPYIVLGTALMLLFPRTMVALMY